MQGYLFKDNPSWCHIEEIPLLDEVNFWEAISENITYSDFRIITFFASVHEERAFLWALLGNNQTALLKIFRCVLESNSFESHTDVMPEIHLFEREIAEQFNLIPQNHPWLKPVRFEPDFLEHIKSASCGDMMYYGIKGEDIHEVAVGPVHAGIIEPGHFRFQCYGEEVAHLEISLGYQHRGIERALLQGPHPNTLFQMEALAGDSTIAHTLAYAQLMETMKSLHVRTKSHLIRALALELERIANHVGDIGALSGDVAFLTTASYCGKLRGDFLNLTARLCGSRFGRGLIRLGGVGYDVDYVRVSGIKNDLIDLRKKTLGAMNLFFQSPSSLERLQSTGKITKEDVLHYGFVGQVAKSCGVMCDVRHHYPFGQYIHTPITPCTESTGDVLARASLRYHEILSSFELIETFLTQLSALPKEKPCTATQPQNLPPHALGISLVEGHRGEIVHVALTDAQGRFARYKVTDPSFRNWTALALAMRGTQISDFPLCNKSFNLSYCGFDL